MEANAVAIRHTCHMDLLMKLEFFETFNVVSC